MSMKLVVPLGSFSALVRWFALVLAVVANASAVQAAPGGQSWLLVQGFVAGMGGIETLGRIPGDIRNFDITPVWPDAGTTAPPGTPELKTYTPTNLGKYIQKNEFFDPSQYSLNCDNSLVLTPAVTLRAGPDYYKSYPATYACKVTAAPVVDMDWVHANLDAKGYTYEISYPLENHGNSRALISWVKSCWIKILGQSAPAYCWQGYARLEGAPEGWHSQYTARTVCVYLIPGSGGTCGRWQTLPYGSNEQAAQMAWPEPYRGTAVALFSWTDGVATSEKASQLEPLSPSLWPLSDDWLSGMGPPAVSASLPSIPPYVPAGEPSAINVGGASSGGGAGAAGETNTDGRNTLKFDFAAYCNAPGKDGEPRSPAWIESCIAGR